MNIFKRTAKPENNITGFKKWLLEQPERDWVAKYVRRDGEVRESEAFHDMQFSPNSIYPYTMYEFKMLVADLYCEYLGITNKAMYNEDVAVLSALAIMPINVAIFRVKPKAQGNNWGVQYNRGTKYYGKTLNLALLRALKIDKKFKIKFEEQQKLANEKADGFEVQL